MPHIPPDYAEHIEAMLNLYAENGEQPNAHDIALGVADIMCAQGLVEAGDDAEFDLLVMEVEKQVEYYR